MTASAGPQPSTWWWAWGLHRSAAYSEEEELDTSWGRAKTCWATVPHHISLQWLPEGSAYQISHKVLFWPTLAWDHIWGRILGTSVYSLVMLITEWSSTIMYPTACGKASRDNPLPRRGADAYPSLSLSLSSLTFQLPSWIPDTVSRDKPFRTVPCGFLIHRNTER